jgi:hypothetical protein
MRGSAPHVPLHVVSADPDWLGLIRIDRRKRRELRLVRRFVPPLHMSILLQPTSVHYALTPGEDRRLRAVGDLQLA